MADGQGQPAQKFNFANATVLMVDASPICLEVAANILMAYGFRKLHRCQDLEQAAQVLRTNLVHLLLIDPYSYGEKGYGFIKKLRANTNGPNAKTPIIVVASYTPVRLITSARECGADYVVAKPFSTGALLERILWVASREGQRSELVSAAETVSQEGSGMELW